MRSNLCPTSPAMPLSEGARLGRGTRGRVELGEGEVGVVGKRDVPAADGAGKSGF